MSFRDDDHPASNMPTPAAQQTDEQTDNLLQTDTPEQTPAAPGTEVTEVEKDEEENVSPEIRYFSLNLKMTYASHRISLVPRNEIPKRCHFWSRV